MLQSHPNDPCLISSILSSQLTSAPCISSITSTIINTNVLRLKKASNLFGKLRKFSNTPKGDKSLFNEYLNDSHLTRSIVIILVSYSRQ